MEGSTTELGELRARIDEVDREILEQLNRRAEFVTEVGRIKQGDGRPVYEPARERGIVDGLRERNRGPFPQEGIAPVFREIISATRSLEEPVRVAYLGPEGTFSHQAALAHFGALAKLGAVASIPEVFGAVESGRAELGIVPVENTTEGVVTQTLDALAEHDVPVCAESVLRVSLALLSRAPDAGAVRRVLSHPQPLAQCRRWLDEHLPGAERIEAASTTAAARAAAEDPEAAAIASGLAGEVYDLPVLASGIEDRRGNTTRFLVVGGSEPRPTGKDLTSLVFTIRRDEAGALFRLLTPLAEQGINLTTIQLRPIQGKPWEYLFFIDCEGHRSEASVQRALEAASQVASSTRVLGSFPRAEVQRGGATGER